MTDRAYVHTGNSPEQFLFRNRTLILLHTVSEQLLKRSKNLSGTVCEHSLSYIKISCDLGPMFKRRQLNIQ